ncbi:MAG: DNA polymerase III subunit [Pirellulales bacterium]
MSWQGILGHDGVVEQFRLSLARGRLASSFLFVGPPAIGKRAFALKLAQSLLCQARPEASLDPCGECPSCAQVSAGTHPDLETVCKPPDKSFIPLALFIGDDEHRMREGLCHHIAMRPFMGGRKIAIIDDADDLNPEGANCLLKTLEEPPPRSVLILIGTSPAKQLPTIRSRCQMIRFKPLGPEVVAELLVAKGLIESPAEARRLAAFSEGSLDRARELAAEGLWAFRRQMLEKLSEPMFDSLRLATAVGAFIDEGGKEASAKRVRARQCIGFAADFYRQLLRGLVGATTVDDADLHGALGRVKSAWRGGEDTASACLERCLEAVGQIDRNVNQATAIECWLDDLAHITITGRTLPPHPPVA